MNTDELRRIIGNKNLNFIGQCGSVLQMNGVNAAIYYLESKGVEINGVVLLCTSKTLTIDDYKKNYFLQRKNIRYITVDNAIVFHDSFEKIDVFRRALITKRKLEPVYFVGANLIHSIYYSILKRGKRAIYVEIDDGIENYLNRHKEFMIIDFAGKNIPKTQLPIKYFKRVISDISYNMLYSIVKTKGNYDGALILNKHVRPLRRNEEIIRCYHTVLNENGSKLKYSELKHLENSVIIVGNGNDDIKLLSELVRMLTGSDVTVVFKPHPRDKDIERYVNIGCSIFQNESISLETIVERLDIKPQSIIGDYSTTLITGKILFDINTISYAKLICKDEYNKKMTELFFDSFNEIVMFPDSISELKSMLRRL